MPFHVLLEDAGFGDAFAASWQAFALNTGPLLVYAAAVDRCCSASGCVTMGVALVVVLPLWTAASYAAWKDIFGVARRADRRLIGPPATRSARD